jgi:hypothetical protein
MTVRVKYFGYHGSPVTIQNSAYEGFVPVANDWGTKHPVPEKTSPL